VRWYGLSYPESRTDRRRRRVDQKSIIGKLNIINIDLLRLYLFHEIRDFLYSRSPADVLICLGSDVIVCCVQQVASQLFRSD
jgi:hypothetical protein